MKKMSKRILAVALAAVMVLGLVPSAFAAEDRVTNWDQLKDALNTGSNGNTIIVANNIQSSDSVETKDVEPLLVPAGVTATLGLSNTVKRLDFNASSNPAGDHTKGSVIRVEGTLTLKGFDEYTSSITSGRADKGGGIYVASGGTLIMMSGNIYGNAADKGGGVYVEKGGTFIMYGGTIRHNGGEQGVYVEEGANVYMGGTAVIQDNPYEEAGLTGTDLYLEPGAVLQPYDQEPLRKGAHIGIQAPADLTDDGFRVFTAPNGKSAEYVKYFFPNGTEQYKLGVKDKAGNDNDFFIAPKNSETVRRPATDWQDVQNAFNDGDDLFLYNDITATADDEYLELKAGLPVTLDLNGKTLSRGLTPETVKLYGNVITIPMAASLTVDDFSADKNGKITGGSNRDGMAGGIIILANDNNEILSGGHNYYNLEVLKKGEKPGGQLILNAGSITGNWAEKNGAGGVHVNGTSWIEEDNDYPRYAPVGTNDYLGGKFIMNGGSITDNTAWLAGGGVEVSDGVFIMNAGTITGNKTGGVYSHPPVNTSDPTPQRSSSGYAAGVYVSGGKFTMLGGSITGNTVDAYASFECSPSGAGLYISDTTDGRYNGARVTLGNTVNISGNTGVWHETGYDQKTETGKVITKASNMCLCNRVDMSKWDNRYGINQFVYLDKDNPLTDEAKIYLTLEDTKKADGGYLVAKYADGTTDAQSYMKNFFYDDDSAGFTFNQKYTDGKREVSNIYIYARVDMVIKAGANMTQISGKADLKDVTEDIEPIVFKADEGYFFSESYAGLTPVSTNTDTAAYGGISLYANGNGTLDEYGLTVTRSADGDTVTVSGRPTKTVDYTMPDAEEPVTVTFVPGENTTMDESYGKATQKVAKGTYVRAKSVPNKGYRFSDDTPDSQNGFSFSKDYPITNTLVYAGGWANQDVTITLPDAVKMVCSVTVNGNQNMTHDTNSGALSQPNLSGAMTEVVFTADDGYYFPEGYGKTAGKDGITVTRVDNKTISVSGMPEEESVTIDLPAPAEEVWTVTVKPGQNMSNQSGDETQENLTGPMTEVKYKADEGYYFPDDIFTIEKDGIKVAPSEDGTLTVSGTPTNNVEIELPDAEKTHHSVTITPADNMTTTQPDSDLKQTVASRQPMKDIIFTAEDGYYFPEGYGEGDGENDVNIKRDSATQITVSGIPTDDVNIELPAPTKYADPVFKDDDGNIMDKPETLELGKSTDSRGFVFVGWEDEEGNVIDNIDDAKPGATYTPKWQDPGANPGENPGGNGGTPADSSKPAFSDGAGNTVSNPETFEKGKTVNAGGGLFDGWFDPDGNELTDLANAKAGVTYTARWRLADKAAAQSGAVKTGDEGVMLYIGLAGAAVLAGGAAVAVTGRKRREE